ncbi:MAG: hypothetical protein FJ276_33585 [Planctomycetes bacterium]|nr:hypothetical protein [Planctomycetota bacterium]
MRFTIRSPGDSVPHSAIRNHDDHTGVINPAASAHLPESANTMAIGFFFVGLDDNRLQSDTLSTSTLGGRRTHVNAA